MSYTRVIPRDLFNEANLLKCVGRFWIETERFQSTEHAPSCVDVEHDGGPFAIEQDEDGALTVSNVQVSIHGRRCRLWRPLNSRRSWPLYLQRGDEDSLDVFTDSGELSPEVMALIQA